MERSVFSEDRSTTPQSRYTYREVMIGIEVLLLGLLFIFIFPSICFIDIVTSNIISVTGLSFDILGAIIVVFPETEARRLLFNQTVYGKLECARHKLFTEGEYVNEDITGFNELKSYLLENHKAEESDTEQWQENSELIYAMVYDPTGPDIEVRKRNSRPRIHDADAINYEINSKFSGFFYRLGAGFLVFGFMLQILSRLSLPC